MGPWRTVPRAIRVYTRCDDLGYTGYIIPGEKENTALRICGRCEQHCKSEDECVRNTRDLVDNLRGHIHRLQGQVDKLTGRENQNDMTVAQWIEYWRGEVSKLTMDLSNERGWRRHYQTMTEITRQNNEKLRAQLNELRSA